MAGQELRVEEPEPPEPQPVHQIDEGDLRRVGAPREHAFAEERRPQRHAEDTPGQIVADPDLERVRVVHRVQLAIEPVQGGVDPGLGAAGAEVNNLTEELSKTTDHLELQKIAEEIDLTKTTLDEKTERWMELAEFI